MRENSPCNLVNLVRALYYLDLISSDDLIVVVNTYNNIVMTRLILLDLSANLWLSTNDMFPQLELTVVRS